MNQLFEHIFHNIKRIRKMFTFSGNLCISIKILDTHEKIIFF
jgi:hypothetical protein